MTTWKYAIGLQLDGTVEADSRADAERAALADALDELSWNPGWIAVADLEVTPTKEPATP